MEEDKETNGKGGRDGWMDGSSKEEGYAQEGGGRDVRAFTLMCRFHPRLLPMDPSIYPSIHPFAILID